MKKKFSKGSSQSLKIVSVCIGSYFFVGFLSAQESSVSDPFKDCPGMGCPTSVPVDDPFKDCPGKGCPSSIPPSGPRFTNSDLPKETDEDTKDVLEIDDLLKHLKTLEESKVAERVLEEGVSIDEEIGA